MASPARRSCSVLGMRVDELDYDSAIARIRQWAREAKSRYMCVSTVHMVMETYDDPAYRGIVNGADLVCADGVPVVWASRKLGLVAQQRVFGPVLTAKLCAMAAAEGIPVGFYGSTTETIADLNETTRKRYPGLKVAYSYSPPFRLLTAAEDDAVVKDLVRSGVQILFVGLGCPKQERWMYEHHGRVPAVMLGVGWAFDIVSERDKAAPEWIQKIALEWLYRLVLNPKKLWRRHLKNNPRFIVLILQQLLGAKRYPLDAQPSA